MIFVVLLLKFYTEEGNWDHREYDDYFSQTGTLFCLMTPKQQQALFENTAASMGSVPNDIKARHIKHCTAADEAYGEGIKKALGM